MTYVLCPNEGRHLGPWIGDESCAPEGTGHRALRDEEQAPYEPGPDHRRKSAARRLLELFALGAGTLGLAIGLVIATVALVIFWAWIWR